MCLLAATYVTIASAVCRTRGNANLAAIMRVEGAIIVAAWLMMQYMCKSRDLN